MFARIVPRYDLMNRLMTLGRDAAWRQATVDAVAPTSSARVLDVGCGTGDLTIAFARRGVKLAVGLDPVPAMLDAARVKLSRQAPYAGLVEGDGLRLPFPDSSFECVASAFVMRNVPDVPAALREAHRVLRPGGRVAILELTPLRVPVAAQLFRLYFHRVVPLVGGLISGERGAYAYLPASVDRFPTADRLAAMMDNAGFGRVRFKRFMLGTVALHVGER
jgi:demethylmenaquinone methyltransferase/2-methoxy-6-polyprenyl-1,4-benzoquinol methylase